MYEVNKYEKRIFSLKNKLNSEEWWKVFYSKYAPSLVVYFSIFRTICEYDASKNISLLLRAIFSHLRTNQSAAQQVRDPSMQTSDKIGRAHVWTPVTL